MVEQRQPPKQLLDERHGYLMPKRPSDTSGRPRLSAAPHCPIGYRRVHSEFESTHSYLCITIMNDKSQASAVIPASACHQRESLDFPTAAHRLEIGKSALSYHDLQPIHWIDIFNELYHGKTKV